MHKIIKLFNEFNIKHPKWKLFSDFLEIASLMYSNLFLQDQKLEDRYKEIIADYSEKEIN